MEPPEQREPRVYRYGDFPYLFWDADPGAVLDVDNPIALARILERGKPEDIYRLTDPATVRRHLDQLPLPPSSRWFWRLVVDPEHAAR